MSELSAQNSGSVEVLGWRDFRNRKFSSLGHRLRRLKQNEFGAYTKW